MQTTMADEGLEDEVFFRADRAPGADHDGLPSVDGVVDLRAGDIPCVHHDGLPRVVLAAAHGS